MQAPAVARLLTVQPVGALSLSTPTGSPGARPPLGRVRLAATLRAPASAGGEGCRRRAVGRAAQQSPLFRFFYRLCLSYTLKSRDFCYRYYSISTHFYTMGKAFLRETRRKT